VVDGDRREERLRHPEHHRILIEHERAEYGRLPEQEPQALAQRLEPCTRDFPTRGAGAISQTASSEAPNEAASITYVQGTPAAAIRIPPSAGPAIAPTFK
jgi:hypothetical protein